MKTLQQYISEELDRDSLGFKVDCWLRSRPAERELWDAACRPYRETRQFNDEAIQAFIDATDVRAFVDFLDSDVASNDGVSSDDFSVIKKTIENL